MKYLMIPFTAMAIVSCATQESEVVEPVDSVNSASTETKKKEAESFDASLITGVEVEQVFELRESGKIYLIDTRPPLFYRRGNIDGSVNLPLKKFASAYAAQEAAIRKAVADGKVVVIYCASEKCSDSYLMAKKFAQEGIPSSVFKGGWRLWQQTGLE